MIAFTNYILFILYMWMCTCVNKNLISAKQWIKYLGLLFPLMVVVLTPFLQGLPAWLSWLGDPWTREQAPLRSTQKREINNSPRPDAHQSPTPQWSQARRETTNGKSGLLPRSEIWFEAGTLCQHWLEIPSPTRPYTQRVFWRHFSRHISNVAG